MAGKNACLGSYRCKSPVNWRLTLLFGETNQSAQNKDMHVVQIKPKAIKSFENVATSGEIAPPNTSSKKKNVDTI